MIALYTEATASSLENVGGSIIYGFQGRYFIPCILFVLIACSSTLLRRFKIADKVRALSESILPASALIGLCLAVTLMIVKYFS